MRRIIPLVLYLSAISCFLACSGGGTAEENRGIHPDSLISREEMIMIFADVQIIESALLLKRNRGEETAELAGSFYKTLFEKYKISRSRYEENVIYYQSDQEEFGKIYEKVTEIIDKKLENLKDTVKPVKK